ncbi:MAG: isoprenylcysteine carboxylmethyltransferase family protein [Roseiarcus sp.]
MQDRADVKVLPPFVLLGFLALGLLLAILAPTPVLPEPIARLLGIVVIVLSIVFVFLAVREIARAKTALDVRKPTTTLVTSGIFRITRNPIYFSMILLVAGVGLMLNSLWSILLAAPIGGVLWLMAIRPEERYLDGRFGGAYRAYCTETPRWLSARGLLGAFQPRPRR